VAEGVARRLAAGSWLDRAVIEAVLAAVREAVTVMDVEGRFVYANDAAARMCNLDSAAEMLALPPAEVLARFQLLRPDGSPLDPAELPSRRVLAGEESAELTVAFRPAGGGAEHAARVRAFGIRDAGGALRHVVSLFTRVTEERRRERREAFVAEAGGAIGATLDYFATLRSVAELAVPRLADWCAIDLLAIDGSLERVAAAHVDPAKVELLGELQRRWPWTAGDDSGAGRAIRSREPVASGLDLGMLAGAEGDPEHVATLYEVGAAELLSVPIDARGRVLGALTLGSAAGDRLFRGDERVLAVDLAARAGIAIDNARLFGEVQAAHEEAEVAAETLRKLERIGQAALAHLFLEDLVPALLEQVAESLSADTAAILLLDERTQELKLRATVGFHGETREAVPIPLGQGLAGRVAVEREASVIDDLDEIRLFSPHLRRRGIKSLVIIPLTVEDRVIGIAHAGSEERGHFTPGDLRLLELIADRLALAISRSTLLDAERRAHERLAFLAEASAILSSSHGYEEALVAVADLAVARVADFCAIDLRTDDGLRRVAIAHADPELLLRARDDARRHQARLDDPRGPGKVARSGVPELDADPPAGLGLTSAATVPLVVRGRTLGAITLGRSGDGEPLDEHDHELAQDLARRAAVAVDNAQLYRQAEERSQAARVLASVGDGVVLVDSLGIVRYWNRAAEMITGVRRANVMGRRASEAIPGWSTIAERVRVAPDPLSVPRAQSLPLGIGERELWLSVSGVAVIDGTVYVFRDLSEERALEQLRSEFVSTVSHELRTPLAAIYGAAITLRRTDLALDEEQRETLLDVVAKESDRLARTVNAILWASRLDSGALTAVIERCEPLGLAGDVVAAQRAHLPPEIRLELHAEQPLPEVDADPDKVRQVLANLVDNAVKYSPDGGVVRVTLAPVEGRRVRFSVADEGLGIPPSEQRRIFEKFYRLDPNMIRGIGGTGLGLYICRELVRRMHGRIWVDSELGRGSTFSFELPVAVGDAVKPGAGDRPDESGRSPTEPRADA